MSPAVISTADVYSNGDSERLVGEAIRKFDIPREGVDFCSLGPAHNLTRIDSLHADMIRSVIAGNLSS